MKQRFYLMKELSALCSVLLILGFAAGLSRAGSDQDLDLSERLSEIYHNTPPEQAHGMTRADLAKAYREAPGGTKVSPPAFQPHQTFICRTCGLIKADVDFLPANTQPAGPMDIITNISLPYIDFAAPTNTGSNLDAALTQELRAVQADFDKIKPGVTRAELDKLFERDNGPMVEVPDKHLFHQHQKFDYRRCSYIFIDVDFRPSPSTKERPTDVITKVSKPHIFAGPIG